MIDPFPANLRVGAGSQEPQSESPATRSTTLPVARFGFRRLFDALGCGLAGLPEQAWQTRFGMDTVEVYLGPQPKWGIFVGLADRYIVPGEDAVLFAGGMYTDASASPHPRNFFNEVTAYTDLEVSDEVWAGVVARTEGAAGHFLGDAEEIHGARLRRLVESVSGSMGIRLHRQFVLSLLNENYVGRVGEEPVHEFHSPALENLDSVAVQAEAVSDLLDHLPDLVARPDQLRKFSDMLYWLRRSWQESDPFTKFVVLFIPMEMLLQGIPGELSPDQASARDRIVAALETSDHADLASELRRLLPRPSVVSRFEALAQRADLPSKEADTIAFRQFNATRNAVLHRGTPEVGLIVPVNTETNQHLEDLVERYVSYTIWGDARVYPSSWR